MIFDDGNVRCGADGAIDYLDGVVSDCQTVNKGFTTDISCNCRACRHPVLIGLHGCANYGRGIKTVVHRNLNTSRIGDKTGIGFGFDVVIPFYRLQQLVAKVAIVAGLFIILDGWRKYIGQLVFEGCVRLVAQIGITITQFEPEPG